MLATTRPVAMADAVPWDFLSTLIWQILLLWLLRAFRPQIAQLLTRIASFKAAGAEILFQQQTDEASRLAEGAAEIAPVARAVGTSDPIMPGPDGFLESSSVERVVAESGRLSEGEKIKDLLLLFATQRQRTWIAATNERLFYVLDDGRTQASGHLIQRVQHFRDIKAIRAEFETAAAGIVHIGEPPGWYFSSSLFPDPALLESRIRAMIRLER